MTHPIVEARRRRAQNMAKMISPDQTKRLILEEAFFLQLTEHDAEVLRLAREPGESVLGALDDAWIDGENIDVWRAGIDALTREIAATIPTPTPPPGQ